VHRLAYLLLAIPAIAAADEPPVPPETPLIDNPTPQLPQAQPPAQQPPAPVVTQPPPAAPPPEPRDAFPNYEDSTVRLGGYFQPQFRMRQNSDVSNDEDGFRFARVRPQVTAQTTAGNLKLSAFMEVEVQPQFVLEDMYGTVLRDLPGHGHIAVDFGQVRVPISRQNLLSDAYDSFVDRAQISTIGPDRDLGMRFEVVPPHATWLKIRGGVFNGEGKNQVQNLNEQYLYAGRIEITPFGRNAPLADSAFSGDTLTIAGSIGHNNLTPGDFREKQLMFGYDVFFAYKGVSGSFEYYQVNHTFEATDVSKLPGPDYHANGFVAQLCYLFPFGLPPYEKGRFELGFRVEEIDRNDEVKITMPGDPNQSVREYTAVLSYYLRQHNLKAQLAASHYTEIETLTESGADATYPNDQLLLQITYRMQ
jgi:hypothetical protein